MALPYSPPAILANDGNLGFRAGAFGFNTTGADGQTVIVEGSTDLLHWTPLATNTLGATPYYFSDPQSGDLAGRFYRLATP